MLPVRSLVIALLMLESMRDFNETMGEIDDLEEVLVGVPVHFSRSKPARGAHSPQSWACSLEARDFKLT